MSANEDAAAAVTAVATSAKAKRHKGREAAVWAASAASDGGDPVAEQAANMMASAAMPAQADFTAVLPEGADRK